MDRQQLDGIARREFLRRGAALGIGGTALASLLAACGSSDDDSGGEDDGAAKIGGAIAAWAWQPKETGYPAVWEDAGKRWLAGGTGRDYKYTYVEFANYFTKFKTANAGGQPPDVLEMAWSGEYRDMIRANALVALDDVLPDLPKFFPNVMESLAVDGKTYTIPQDVNTLSIAYNTDLFEELGLEVPETLDDMLAMAEPIRAAGYQPLALAIKDQWPCGDVWYQQLAYTDDTNKALNEANADSLGWDAPPFKDAAAVCEQIGKSGIIADGASSLDTMGSVALFGKQKAAMLYPAGNFLTGLINSANGGKFKYDLFRFPPLDAGVEPRATGGPAVLWSIPSNAKNEGGGREFLKLLTDKASNDLMVKAGFFPASETDLTANKDALYQTMGSFQDTAASRAIFNPEVSAALLNSVSSVLAGRSGPDAVSDAMTKAV
jgi:raffinose/stachyose/melibiose transport system substrate-binding protein